jgi:periplasmic divalent cation tolerance protein
MEETVLVYTTWPDMGQAEAAGRTLIEARLCACVNILPGMIAVYAWQGAVERAEECVMILKTRRSLSLPLMEAVKEAHPYDTPAIFELPVGKVDPAYQAWISAETSG